MHNIQCSCVNKQGRPQLTVLTWGFYEVSHNTFSPSRQRNYAIKDIIIPISKHYAIKTYKVESVVQLLTLWMSVLERNKWWVFMLQSLYSPKKKSFRGIKWRGSWMQPSIILDIMPKIELLPSWESVPYPSIIVSNVLGFTEYLSVFCRPDFPPCFVHFTHNHSTLQTWS